MIPLRNIRRIIQKAGRDPVYAFRVLIKRERIYLSYWFGRGKSSFPEAVTLFLTHRCNLRCKMCGQWGESGVTKFESPQNIRKELSFDELKKIIDEVSGFKPNITLFGGEPLLYSYCRQLIKYVKEKGMHCLMITNGYVLNEAAEEVVETGLDELNVSMDGGRELHDKIRGMPGLYDRIMNGLKEVNRSKKKRGKRKPFINLQCTITKYNYNHLQEMLEVAREAEAASVTFHNLIFLGREVIEGQKQYDRLLDMSSRYWEGFNFDPEIDPDFLYSRIKEVMAASSRYRFGVDFYPNFSHSGIREYYNNPSYLPSEYSARCLSPWMAAYIFPDGDIRPCLNFDYSYGNIKKSKFSEIWNGASAVKFRRTIKERGILPICVRCTELYRY